jgi:ubiquinone/menaquinone biosynthesis C-methylase UbiE
MDADEFRDEALARWDAAAAGWEARRAEFQSAAQPVSMWMVEALNPQPGHTILELAAGPGDTGLLAAELVQPGGKVILTDASPNMVEAAKRRAAQLGIRNIEARTMGAEWLDFPTASIDGVLVRFGYMLLADPASSLRETRRVLRRGGRVALAAWTSGDENPWMTSITKTLVEQGHAEKPPAGEPGPMAFAEPGTIERLLEEAGFGEIEVEPLDFAFAFDSTDAHFDHQVAVSTRVKEQVAPLSPADHTRLRDAIDEKLEPYIRADGSVELPARTWVAVASA